jgi:flagellar assembly protein FliH
MSSRFIPKEKTNGCQPWQLRAFAQGPAALNAAGCNDELEQARARGYADGFDEGRRAGSDAGMDLVREQARQLGQLMAAAHRSLGALGTDLAQELAEFAFAIARQVVQRELASDRAAVVAIVHQALGALPAGTQHGRLCLNPADAQLVRDALGEDLIGKAWRIVEDASLAPGGCRVVAPCGDVDAALETRWARLEAAIGAKSTRLNSGTSGDAGPDA